MTHLCDNWWFQDNLFSWPRQDRPRSTQLWGRGQTHGQLNKESTSQLERDVSSVHMHPVLWADLCTNSDKSLWRMLSSQFILHQGVDTEYALWTSLRGWESVSFQALRTEQRICSTKVGVGYTLSLSERLARWVTWRQLHLWKGRCEQGSNSRKMLSWVNCTPCN